MIVVAIVGILAVLAIYGVRKYLANAKTAEARNSLGQIAKDAAAAVEREKGTEPIVAAGRDLAAPARLLRQRDAGSAGRRQRPPGRSTSRPRATGVGHARRRGWSCLKFSMDEPQYFEYEYTGVNISDPKNGGFTAYAHGDLNGDGVPSTFQVSGQASSGAGRDLAEHPRDQPGRVIA